MEYTETVKQPGELSLRPLINFITLVIFFFAQAQEILSLSESIFTHERMVKGERALSLCGQRAEQLHGHSWGVLFGMLKFFDKFWGFIGFLPHSQCQGFQVGWPLSRYGGVTKGCITWCRRLFCSHDGSPLLSGLGGFPHQFSSVSISLCLFPVHPSVCQSGE